MWAAEHSPQVDVDTADIVDIVAAANMIADHAEVLIDSSNQHRYLQQQQQALMRPAPVTAVEHDERRAGTGSSDSDWSDEVAELQRRSRALHVILLQSNPT